MKDDHVYLLYILDCIARIEEYTRTGKAAFFQDQKTQDATLRNLHTLSESTQRLSDTLKAVHPEVPWREVAAFRNVVVHNYLGIDLHQIWDIVEQDLPVLKGYVRTVLSSL